MTQGETTIKVSPFNGTEKRFQKWKYIFISRAEHYKFDDVILGRVEVPKAPAEGQKLSTEQEDIKKRNAHAMRELMLSMEDNDGGREAFMIVRNTFTDEYPGGNAREAWLALCEEYEPTTAPTIMSLKSQFYHEKLKKGECPTAFIRRLKYISDRLRDMNHKIPEDDLITYVLNTLSLHPEYKDDIARVEKRLGAKTDPLTLSELVT